MLNIIPNYEAFKFLARRTLDTDPSLFLGTGQTVNADKIVKDISDFDILKINHDINKNAKPVSHEDFKTIADGIHGNDELYRTQFWSAKRNLLRNDEIDLKLTIPVKIPLYEALGLYFIGVKDDKIYVSGINRDSIRTLDDDEVPELKFKNPRDIKDNKTKRTIGPFNLNGITFKGLNSGKVLEITKTDTSNEEKKEVKILLHFAGTQHQFALMPPQPIPLRLVA